MRTSNGANDIKSIVNIGRPIAHGFVDGVLERGRARGDRTDLRAELAQQLFATPARPGVVAVRDGSPRLIVRGETEEDLLNRDMGV